MSMPKLATRKVCASIALTETERRIAKQAAGATDQTLSKFVRESVMQRAYQIIGQKGDAT